MADVVLKNLKREYGTVTAVHDISLTVADGEFLTLLGPSGCGKSTTLGMLAGLDKPDAGFISVGGEVFYDQASGTYVDAEQRNLGLVFQSYALWPHMTVRDNVGFALKLRRIPAKQREELIRKSLTLVEMDQYIDRYPGQLSGGQQQRVALARTLAYNPAILLLDEPLSNLDAKLRDKARSWLRRLQSDVGITTIFVTHDQVEALALSDRIAVMDNGRVVQIGTPREIYDRPATPFVADFIGTSNFVTGTVLQSDADSATVRLRSGDVIRTAATTALGPGSGATIAFRPERVEILPDHSQCTDNVLKARVTEEAYLGSRIVYSLEAAGTVIRIETLDRLQKPEMLLRIPEQSCAVFAGPSQEA